MVFGGHGRVGGRGRGRSWPAAQGLCLFCDPETQGTTYPYPEQSTATYLHERRFCPVFRTLKQGLNPRSYCDARLKPSEKLGFAAAGVIFVTRSRGTEPEFLLAREYKSRDGGLEQNKLYVP